MLADAQTSPREKAICMDDMNEAILQMFGMHCCMILSYAAECALHFAINCIHIDNTLACAIYWSGCFSEHATSCFHGGIEAASKVQHSDLNIVDEECIMSEGNGEEQQKHYTSPSSKDSLIQDTQFKQDLLDLEQKTQQARMVSSQCLRLNQQVVST